jgi:hypothetical protein
MVFKFSSSCCVSRLCSVYDDEMKMKKASDRAVIGERSYWAR